MVKLRATVCTKYHPLNDPKYMSEAMKHFFRKKLTHKLKELQKKSLGFGETLQESNLKEPDFVDQSCLTEQRFNHLAYYCHERRLLHEIELALQRLYSGNYGYCLATGEPIGIKRLLAEPCAKYCLEAQTLREKSRFFNR